MAEFDGYKKSYEGIIEDSIRFSGRDHDFFTRAKAYYFKEILAEQANRPKIIDIGCGHGLIHSYLTDVADITGVDVAAEVVDIARSQNPRVEYKCFNGTDLPFSEASFDAALMICVLHHVPPPQWLSLLNETRRILKVGASLSVFEHNPLNPLTQYVVRSNVIDKDAVLLTSGKLVSLFQKAGYVDVKRRFILLTPFAGSFARGLERAAGGLPLGAQYYVTGTRPAS